MPAAPAAPQAADAAAAKAAAFAPAEKPQCRGAMGCEWHNHDTDGVLQTLFYAATARHASTEAGITNPLPTARLPEDRGNAETGEGYGAMHVRVKSSLTSWSRGTAPASFM